MRVPAGFTSGTGTSTKADQKKAATMRQKRNDFDDKVDAAPDDWEFSINGFAYRGE